MFKKIIRVLRIIWVWVSYENKFVRFLKRQYFKNAYNQEYLKKTIPKITKKHDKGESMSGFSKLVYMRNQLDTGRGVLKKIK